MVDGGVAAADVGAVRLVIGAADYGFHWWRHEQNLKMTKEEVKQEQKEENGDPHVRSAAAAVMQREMRKPRGFQERGNGDGGTEEPDALCSGDPVRPGDDGGSEGGGEGARSACPADL